MHVLCVAEKPSIAKSITQILSGGQFSLRTTSNKFIKNYDFTYTTRDTYTVTSVAGHLLAFDFDSAYRSWNSCDPLTLFDAEIEAKVPTDKKSIEKNLVTEARNSQMLMIWTDCDREGENIGMEIVQICRKSNPNINVKRAKFSAIIAQQIHNAAQHPVELDKAQADAVDARTILDLRLGAAFTRMQSLSLQPRFGQLSQQPISYGPCQFPTLGFVVSRYEQVQAFSPETFWYIYLSLRKTVSSGSNEEPEDVEFTWKRGRLFDFEVSLAIYEGVVTNPTARVTSVTQKPTKKWKPLPLTTVELQKSGSRLLKMTPKKILDISEKLYQQGFLSYPRTETDQFDPSFDLMSLIQKQTTDTEWGAFATSLQDGGFTRPRQGKKNDNAHPPIHPTAHVANLVGDEKKVYEYITRRFLACCSKDAEGWETTVNVTCGREEFYSTGLQIIERNYLDVFPYDKWTGKHIPEFEEGEEFVPTVCELKEGQTTRPSYLTEADLVGLMDKNGIGTDATIAQHIQTIVDREYVVEKKEGATKYLIPSKLGIGLVEGYNKIGFEKSLSKPQLRRETERRMVQICQGSTSKQDMLNQSIEQYRELFLRARNEFNQVISVSVIRLGVNVPLSDTVKSVRKHLDGRPPDENIPQDQNPHNDDDNNPGNPPNARPPNNRPPGGGGGNGGDGARRPPLEPDSRSGPRTTSRPPPRPSQIDLSGSLDSNEVLCKCSAPAVERTVAKESANKGRKFRACGNQGGCDFFEWMDMPSGSSVASVTIPSKRSRPQTSGNGGPSSNELPVKRCKCDMTAVERTVIKEGINKGRTFWTCPNSEKARCQFFEWGDEGTKSAPAQASSQDHSRTNDECFKCGQSGHWSSACPNTGSSSNKTSNRAFGNTQSNTMGECFKLAQMLTIHNQISTKEDLAQLAGARVILQGGASQEGRSEEGVVGAVMLQGKWNSEAGLPAILLPSRVPLCPSALSATHSSYPKSRATFLIYHSRISTTTRFTDPMSRLLDPVLATLSPEDINVLDDIIAKAPDATAFTTIFKAYSEVLKQRGLDPGEDVVYYKRLLKLGVIKGADWGTKWRIVKAQLPTGSGPSIRSSSPQKASTSISSFALDPDDVFLSNKLSDDTTITKVSSKVLSTQGFETPNRRTRHKATSESEFSTFSTDNPRHISSRPFVPSRLNLLSRPVLKTPTKPLPTSPKKVYPVDDKEAWRKIDETRLLRDADHFRTQSLLMTCFQTWRRGLEWIRITHNQIDEARANIQLRVYFNRWNNRSLNYRRRVQEVENVGRKRILHSALRFWYKALDKRRARKSDEELNFKLRDFQRNGQQRIYHNAWKKWRQLHLAERFYIQRLSLRTFRQWLSILRNFDHLELMADQFEEGQDQRLVRKLWDHWYRRTSLKDIQIYMAKRSSFRLLRQVFECWSHRAQERKYANSVYHRNILKRSFQLWKKVKSNKQGLEIRGDKYINRCNLVLLRAVMHVWVARERGQLLFRVKEMRNVQSALAMWQHRLQAKRVALEQSLMFDQRVSARFMKTALACWKRKIQILQSQEALAKERYRCTLGYNALLAWRLRLRGHLSLSRTAKIARRYFLERSVWDKWRAAFETVKRKKKLGILELEFLKKSFTKWKIIYRRCKQEKILLEVYEKQAEKYILNKHMELWTKKTISIKLREMDTIERYNKQALSDAFSKWTEAHSRQLENLSLVRSYLDVKREETLRRTFATWLTTTRRTKTRRIRLAEREEEMRLDVLTMAWERWRDRFCENALREAELEVIIRNQRNTLHHAFSSWLSHCNSIPGIRLYATNLKLKMWKKWREALPRAIQASKAEEVHNRKLFRDIFDTWKEAYRTKIALKAVTRARHLRLPTPGYRASLGDERDPPVIKPSIRRPLRSQPSITPPERTPAASIVLLGNRYRDKQHLTNVSPSRPLPALNLASRVAEPKPPEERTGPPATEDNATVSEDNVRALLWTKLRSAQVARHLK